MRKIDTLLFDLDGTLIDSNELILETFRRTFAIFLPLKIFSRQELIDLVGPPLFETFKMVLNDDLIINKMIETYRNIYTALEFDYISIYPNTISMLKYFKEKGFHLAVVTTKFQESAIPSMKHFGIDQYINVLISLDDVKHHKPHPEPIFKALSRFNHQEVVMIGDNTSDLLAGIYANVLTCGLEWSMKKAEIKALNPTFWIEDFKDLISLIEEYNKEEN